MERVKLTVRVQTPNSGRCRPNNINTFYTFYVVIIYCIHSRIVLLCVRPNAVMFSRDYKLRSVLVLPTAAVVLFLSRPPYAFSVVSFIIPPTLPLHNSVPFPGQG